MQLKDTTTNNEVALDQASNSVYLKFAECQGVRSLNIERLCEWEGLSADQQAALQEINADALALLDRAAKVLAGGLL